MANIQTIELTNFKGVENTKIDFSGKANCPVTTLIGLNESGKTTILEGVSHFVSGDNAVSSLFGGSRTKGSLVNLMPVHKKAAFNEKVAISGQIELDEADIEAVRLALKKENYSLIVGTFPRKFRIERSYHFEESVYKELKNTWFLAFDAIPPKGKKSQRFNRPASEDEDPWKLAVEVIRERLPRIAYFPTFLVDMPSKIYLSEHDDETAVNRYYRTVFQDILDSIGGGLSLEKHVAERIASYKAQEGHNWFPSFFGGPSKGPIDAVFQKISSAVTQAVIGSWHRVFQRRISAKSITVEWNIDTQKNDLPYASFVISDGESLYKVSERSLGFRWFFSFLLFTAFKQRSTRPTLFVFDEPAANLHAKAQAELLTSFSRIVDGGHQILYSTHSHHMINPRWLSGAYIAENTALDYDSADEAFGLSAKPTNIVATPYRHFVSQYPSRTSYFQPVIEKLEYITPEIIGAPPFLLVEGITDFYALKLAMLAAKEKYGFSLMPGVGSGASGPLISMLIGRGERFYVLLDDDKAGRTAEKQYREGWYLTNEVGTLAAVDSSFKDAKLESLISAETKETIRVKTGSERPSKKEIGLFLAEMTSVGQPFCLSEDTLANLSKVLSFADKQFFQTPSDA